MSTEIAHIKPSAEVEHVPPPAQNSTGRAMRLVEWAEEAHAANQLAKALCKTPFAGQYKGDADAATAAILKGAEVGLTPVTALGAFDLIQGTPAPKAITLRALVQAHGHEIEVVETSDTVCRVRARRRGSADWQTVTWDMKRAQRLGLTNKDNWRKQPAAMLIARATSEAARLIASDVILGIGYSSEEVADTVVEARRTVKRAAQRAELPTTPEPDLEPESSSDEQPKAEEPSQESPLLNTSGQLARHMFALFNEVGITEKDERLAYVTDVVGREVTTSREMTDADAEAVIGSLTQMRDRQRQDADTVEEPTFDEAGGS